MNCSFPKRREVVSIIAVNYNQTELTCALLDSIRRQDFRDVQTIVVDNGSAHWPEAALRGQYPEVMFLRSEQNLGFAGGNNLALPYATGDYLFFVNNDAEIAPGCIARLVDFLRQTPGAGIVSPLICDWQSDPGQPAVVQYAGMPRVHPLSARSNMDGKGEIDRGQYSAPFPTGYAHGAAMMTPRKVVDAVGAMDEAYFLYYEEVDWCERMLRAGYGVWVEPRARVWHKESSTLQTLGAAKTYYLSRNRVLLMRRHYAEKMVFFWPFLLFVTLPKQLLNFAFRGAWTEMRAFVKGIWWNMAFHKAPQNA